MLHEIRGAWNLGAPSCWDPPKNSVQIFFPYNLLSRFCVDFNLQSTNTIDYTIDKLQKFFLHFFGKKNDLSDGVKFV